MTPPIPPLPPGIRWDGRSPITAISVTRTSYAAPAQWEGRTTDGDVLYLRERHGHVSAALWSDDSGDDWSDVWARSIKDVDLDDPASTPWMPSWISYAELRANLPDWIVTPEHEESGGYVLEARAPADRDAIRERVAELEANRVRWDALLAGVTAGAETPEEETPDAI